jgi:hypothetical protein
MDVLPGSQGPWSFRTERFRWLTWVVVNSDQIEALREFAERARREFDLAQIYFDHHPVTFGIAGIAEHDSS